jgi:outer membrane protein TolC
VELPIFEGGRLRATVRLQDAQAKEAALAYRSTVLSALDEVDDALAAYGDDQARERSLGEVVARNREAVDMARQRYASGVGATTAPTERACVSAANNGGFDRSGRSLQGARRRLGGR